MAPVGHMTTGSGARQRGADQWLARLLSAPVLRPVRWRGTATATARTAPDCVPARAVGFYRERPGSAGAVRRRTPIDLRSACTDRDAAPCAARHRSMEEHRDSAHESADS